MKWEINPLIMTRMRAFQLLFCVIGALLGHLTQACKYSVRDVAFVDLTQESYAFLTIGPEATLAGLKSRIQPVATAVFLDSNIRTGWLNSEDAKSHPGFRSKPNNASVNGSFLYRDALEPLRLIKLAELAEDDTNGIWNRLEKAVHSPIRQKTIEHLLSAYAVVLVVEGKNTQENIRVVRAAQSAADALSRMIPDMPKPVDVPPQVVVVPFQQIESEQAMLWSLEMNFRQPENPQAVVLIGRGRRLGPALQGDEITSSKLQQILAVAGQDCECDLDRSWMQGPMIPVRWGPERQQTAYNNLGFDPDNPLVKAEISRILARGKNPIRVNDTSNIGTELDMLLLGYSEEVLAFDESAIESESVMTEPNPSEDVETMGESMASEFDSNNGLISSEPVINVDSSIGTSNTLNIAGPKQSSTSMRKILMMLAGFCVLAMIGGIAVLTVGRSGR